MRVQTFLGRTASVLDIGCGRGLFLAHMRKLGWTAFGVELSDTAAIHARDVLHLDVRSEPYHRDMFADREFGAVCLWHVFEHLEATRETLLGIARILRPGGVLAIAVPNIDSWQARTTGYSWFHLDLPRHYIHCSPHWLQSALGSAGFMIVDISHFSLEQNVYGWIQSVLNYCGLTHNLLYDLLKRRDARDCRRPFRKYPLQSIISCVMALALSPAALIAAIVESLGRRGGTIEIYAIRTDERPGTS